MKIAIISCFFQKGFWIFTFLGQELGGTFQDTGCFDSLYVIERIFLIEVFNT